MFRTVYAPVAAIIALVAMSVGCNLVGPDRKNDPELAHYKEIAARYDYPEVEINPSMQYATSEAPRTINENAVPQEWWNMSLDEAVQLAVTQSAILRDLGGTVIRSPENARTILGPAVVSSDPRIGMEAALAAFDATIGASVSAEKNDRMVNNFVASGGTRFFQQDLLVAQSQLSKVTTSGTQLILRGTTTYDFNNASFNRFPSTWDSLLEVEARHPLLQGAGTRFNRIAGPNSVPGVYSGVVIARVNTDISVTDFEIGLRDLVSNVENAYWDLYFAYRDLDAKITARNTALETWQRINVMYQGGQPGGTAEREAQAREQYYRFEEDVQNALSGRLQDSTTTNNGTAGGSFRGIGGVLVCERRLRLACGLPITDGRMIRPGDEPTLARISFDWSGVTNDAICRRPELHRQRLAIKRRELELIASRNFLLPRLDATTRYRWRGLGHGLLGDEDLLFDPQDPQGYFGNSSIRNLFIGDFAEWQVGAELTMPIGFRRGYAAVRNAQLLLAREKAVLCEQERQVVHDLSNAMADLARSYQVMNTSFNRRSAAQRQVDILRDKLSKDLPVNLDQLLDAERRLADADIQYYRALVEHTIAIKNIHYEKGTLLEYSHVHMAESLPPADLSPTEMRPPQPTETAPSDPSIPTPSPDFAELEPSPTNDAASPQDLAAPPMFGPPTPPADVAEETIVPAEPEYVPQTVMTPQESLPLPGGTLPNIVNTDPEGPDMVGNPVYADPSKLYAEPTPAKTPASAPTMTEQPRTANAGSIRRPSGAAVMNLLPPSPRAASNNTAGSPTPARSPRPSAAGEPEFNFPENNPEFTEYPQATPGTAPSLPGRAPAIGNVRRPSGAASMKLAPAAPQRPVATTPTPARRPEPVGPSLELPADSIPAGDRAYENSLNNHVPPTFASPDGGVARQPAMGNVRRPSGAASMNLMPPRNAPAAVSPPTIAAPQQPRVQQPSFQQPNLQQPVVQQPVMPQQLESESSLPLPGSRSTSAAAMPTGQQPPASVSSRRRPSNAAVAPQFSASSNSPNNVPYETMPSQGPRPQVAQPRVPQLEGQRRASSAASMNLLPPAPATPSTPAINSSLPLAPPSNQSQFNSLPPGGYEQYQQPQYQPSMQQQLPQGAVRPFTTAPPVQPQTAAPPQATVQPQFGFTTNEPSLPLPSMQPNYNVPAQPQYQQQNPPTQYAPVQPQYQQPQYQQPAAPPAAPRQPTLEGLRRPSSAAPLNMSSMQGPTAQPIPTSMQQGPSSRLIEQTWFAPGTSGVSGPPMPAPAMQQTAPAFQYLPPAP
ncbi:Outer membrane protein-like protein [Pirellula staleyi DSM 6068]|uniref:Outer membrane protein-like protein n=1 Tax=Pirellula staleyi (strain ATCC 27377 / DSM 6068 / ICPB 4128) TaxID=530564 RepID=D2QZ22_PIRSD|nr:TolC family protein [Pirellula staleyi]ADB16477.1 Outer membrane protein-like protein [Pirellula staleyi DSM 6068]